MIGTYFTSSKRIVVLGGGGFIGSHLCRELVAYGYQVRIFDKVYGERRLIADLIDKIEIVEGDIARPNDVIAALRDADTVFHLIHTTVPGSSMSDQAYA